MENWLGTIELKMATLGLATLIAKRRTANCSKKRERLDGLARPDNMDNKRAMALYTSVDKGYGPRD